MRRGRQNGNGARLRAYAYLRLSVDKEDGKAQSIEAQRHALRAYAERHDIEIVEEFADSGFSGQSDTGGSRRCWSWSRRSWSTA